MVYSIAHTYRTLDLFFPTAISIVPGTLSIVTLCTLVVTVAAFCMNYFRIFTEYRDFFFFTSVVLSIVCFFSALLEICFYSRESYLDNCILSFYTFVQNYPESRQTKFMYNKLTFTALTQDQRIATLIDYFNGRIHRSSKIIFGIIAVWWVTGCAVFLQLFSVPQSLPSPIPQQETQQFDTYEL